MSSTRRRRPLAGAALSLAAAVLLGGCGGGGSGASPSPSPRVDWRTYRSDRLGFSVDVPASWTPEHDDPAVDFEARPDPTDYVKVWVAPLPDPIAPDDLVSQKQTVDASFVGTGYTIVNESQRVVAGTAAVQVIYTAQLPSIGPAFRVRIVLFTGPLAYTIVMQAAPAAHARQLGAVFDQIRDRFRIFPITAPLPAPATSPPPPG